MSSRRNNRRLRYSVRVGCDWLVSFERRKSTQSLRHMYEEGVSVRGKGNLIFDRWNDQSETGGD